MNSRMRTNSQLSTTGPEKQEQKQSKRNKQLEHEQSHRNGDHMEGYQWGGGEWGESTGNKKHKY